MENDRIENAHQGKRPKIQTLENGKKMHTQKLPELSLNSHTWKMVENTYLENGRTENDNTEKDQKY